MGDSENTVKSLGNAKKSHWIYFDLFSQRGD